MRAVFFVRIHGNGVTSTIRVYRYMLRCVCCTLSDVYGHGRPRVNENNLIAWVRSTYLSHDCTGYIATLVVKGWSCQTSRESSREVGDLCIEELRPNPGILILILSYFTPPDSLDAEKRVSQMWLLLTDRPCGHLWNCDNEPFSNSIWPIDSPRYHAARREFLGESTTSVNVPFGIFSSFSCIVLWEIKALVENVGKSGHCWNNGRTYDTDIGTWALARLSYLISLIIMVL